MKRNRYITGVVSLLALLSASCADDRIGYDQPGGDSAIELRLEAQIEQVNASRADDSGFADGDKIGIYVVNYSGDQPGELLPEGNQASNVQFTYDEANLKWTGNRQLYFKDDRTKVDVYGIYPYRSGITDVENMDFSVERNQANKPYNAISSYEASDLLWGKTTGVSPDTPLITVKFNHILSGVQVVLIEGTGFGEGEWIDLEKSVFIGGTVRDAVVNLKEGKATPAGDCDGHYIAANPVNDMFRAVVIPQTVAAGTPLILINVGEESYEFKRTEAMTFSPSKLHKFTLQVNKSASTGKYEFSLVQEAITAWESDLDSHNGEAKEYVVINNENYGGLENAVTESGLDPEKLKNVKITGKLNNSDFEYLRQHMVNLEAINIYEAIVKGPITDWLHQDNWYDVDKYQDKEYTLPLEAFAGLKYLRRVVLPAKLKAIGTVAFRETALTGTVNLPEGLEYIGPGAIGLVYGETNRKSLNGELHLPSTLRYIGGGAFTGTDFTGELVFPESLRYIGDDAFSRCHYLKCDIHLPDGLEYLGSNAFFRVLGMRGKLVYPHSETIVRQIARDTKIESVTFPEHPVEISEGALSGVPLRGDLTIPASVKKFGAGALSNTKLSHVYFPADLDIDVIPENLLEGNRFLIDTIRFPEKVEIISGRAVANCDKLDAVIIPKKVIKIDHGAFEGCSSLTYIRCDAVDPPEVDESAFWGINKDNFTLEVPEQSVDAYRSAPGWSEFRRISAYKNFVARPMKYNVLNKGGERTVILNADEAWEVTAIPEWCHLDKMSGSKKTELKLTVDPMAHNSPDRNGKIVFSLKGANEYTCDIAVGQYDYEYDEDSYVTFQTATQGKGINVFLVGDGYDAVDISSGKMLSDMKEEMEYLFAVEPYTTYRDYFNVYCGIARSDDSGVEDVHHWRNTKFHTVIANSDARLTTDWQAALNYSVEICDPLSAGDLQVGVMLVVNSTIYEGVCYIVGDSFCGVVTRSELDYPNDARGLVQHEVGGHGFGWLGDEYRYHNAFIQKCPCVCCQHDDHLRNQQSEGFALNLSLNGKFKQVPWYHLITNPKYSDIVDVYEGGYFHAKGVFRSEYNSCMNDNVAYYSTWSRQLIVQRIMKLSGKEFSLDEFYAHDIRPQSYIYGSPSRGYDGLVPALHGQEPVFIKDFKFSRKGGKR